MGYQNIPLAIKKEYGDPLSEVIKGYARMGYSMTATAGAMDISMCALRAWVKRLNLRHLFDARHYNSSCRPRGKGWPKGKPNPLARAQVWTDEQMLACVASWSGSAAQFRNADGYPAVSTVLRRFGSWNNAKLKAKEMNYGFNEGCDGVPR